MIKTGPRDMPAWARNAFNASADRSRLSGEILPLLPVRLPPGLPQTDNDLNPACSVVGARQMDVYLSPGLVLPAHIVSVRGTLRGGQSVYILGVPAVAFDLPHRRYHPLRWSLVHMGCSPVLIHRR